MHFQQEEKDERFAEDLGGTSVVPSFIFDSMSIYSPQAWGSSTSLKETCDLHVLSLQLAESRGTIWVCMVVLIGGEAPGFSVSSWASFAKESPKLGVLGAGVSESNSQPWRMSPGQCSLGEG